MNHPGTRRQDYLLQLIKILDPNERRYFKLYSNIQPGEKRYLNLFEALENKTEYNVEELCRELGLSTTQLADEKYYLNQVLLRSLRNFDDETQITSSLHNSIGEAWALFNRRQYDYALAQAEKILSRLIKLEQFSMALNVMVLKQTCLRRLSRFDEIKKLEAESRELTARYTELFEMTQLSYAVTQLEQKRVDVAEAKKLLAQPLFKRRPQGLRTFIVWFNLKNYEHILLRGDAVKWVKFVRHSVEHCAKQPHVLEINPLGYLYMYTDLASAEMGIGNYEKAMRVTNQLLKLLEGPVSSVPKGEIERARLFTLYLKAHALRYMKRYEEACAIAKRIYEQRNLRPVYDQFSFTFEYIIDLLHVGKAAIAMDLINELLQINTDARGDYQQALRVLIIMAQIDLGNFNLVPYLVKSAKIWLKRNKKESNDYALFFSLAGNIARADNSKLRSKAFGDLLQAARAKKMIELDRELDFESWIGKHILEIALNLPERRSLRAS